MPSSFGGPNLGPDPFWGVTAMQNTGIFSGTGISTADQEKIFEDDPRLADTPTKTNQKTIIELEDMVGTTVDDEDLLELLKRRVGDAAGRKSVDERKGELRGLVEPWIEAGLSYRGQRRQPLFLEDGTRNPARPPRGAAGGRAPPQTVPTSTGTATAGTGNRSSTGTGTRQSTTTKALPPAGTGSRSSTNTTRRPGGGTGLISSTGTRKGSSSGVTKGPSSSRGKGSSSGIKEGLLSTGGKGSSKGTPKSPLGGPPMTMDTLDATKAGTTTSTGSSNAGPPQAPPVQTTSGTGGAGWRRRDDLFEPQVMDAAGITWFSPSEEVSALPTLESTIDYNA